MRGPRAARVLRSSILAIREPPCLEASRTPEVNASRIAYQHTPPNTMGMFSILFTPQLRSVILDPRLWQA
jgi:ABC-type dipeptide/oligopeptide/nickel transport system permease subunit